MTTLPNDVVERDRTLQKASDDLARLRWHWTLDETNPERISFREYARQVGAGFQTVRAAANGYAAYLAASEHDIVLAPGQPKSVTDHIELAKMGEERQDAVKAIAKSTGASVSNVAANKREEVDAVLNTARERAEERGTTVEHEIQRAADWREKSRKAAERERDERRKAQTMRYVQFEGLIGKAMQSLRTILKESEGVEFDDEIRELLTSSLGNLRALLNLIDLRIAGQTDVDWDAELERLVN